MAPSGSQNGASRSSARIRVLTNQTVTARFLNPLTGDRPRTRAEKAAFADAAGLRNGNLLDHFTISKPGSSAGTPAKANRGKSAGDMNDDIRYYTRSVVNDDDDDSTSMAGRGLNSGHGARGGGKRKVSEASKRRTTAKKRRPNVTPQDREQDTPGDGDHEATPDWLIPALQLCWPEIFRHAACDSDGVNQGWLLQTATVCKSLAGPVIGVLYESPRIISDKKMQRLIATLELSDPMFYYRGKIRSLHLGPEFLPKIPALRALIRCLPRLKHFSMTHELDQPPYRDLVTMGPKIDPNFWAILDERKHSRPGMVDAPNRLLSWKWSGRLLPDFLSHSQEIIRLHTDGALRDVKRLHLVNFPSLSYIGENSPAYAEVESQILPTVDPELLDEDDTQSVCAHIVMRRCAEIINSLSCLDHLILEACRFVEGWLWPFIPPLKHLEVTHCWRLYTHHIGEFITMNGRNLVTLILNHNSCLSLDFLVDLRRHCPNLEKLVVNMSYYKDWLTNSAEPEFDEALGEGQVPTWPSSLRHIELLHVRPWKPEVAEMVFQSLIDSASELPNLRYLVIKAMLNIDWRKRADMRADWLRRLQDVFLRRPSKPPAPSLPLRPAPQPAPGSDDEATSSKHKASIGPPTRRSGRIHTQHTDSVRRSSRSTRSGYAEPPSDPEDDGDGEASDKDADTDVGMSDGSNTASDGRPFVQGLCERVELTMENHKLAEVQFDMDDFVDASADEESDSDYSS